MATSIDSKDFIEHLIRAIDFDTVALSERDQPLSKAQVKKLIEARDRLSAIVGE